MGGTVHGLKGTLTLQNNGTDTLTLTAPGAFTFATPLEDNTKYAVTILQSPAAQTCGISQASGSIAAANVTAVTVTCSDNPYYVHVSYSNLTGDGLILVNNANDHLTPLAGDTNGGFSTVYTAGDSYTVNIQVQPQDSDTGNQSQTCTASPASGIFGTSDVTVTITCVNVHFLTISVIKASAQNLEISDDFSDTVTFSDSTLPQPFATPYPEYAPYLTHVVQAPQDQNCVPDLANTTDTGAHAVNNPNTGTPIDVAGSFGTQDITVAYTCN